MAAQLADIAIGRQGTVKTVHDILTELSEKLDGIVLNQDGANDLVSTYFSDNNIENGDSSDIDLIIREYYISKGDNESVPDMVEIERLVEKYILDNSLDPSSKLDQEAIVSIVYQYINNDPNNPELMQFATDDDVLALLKKLFPNRDFGDNTSNP